MPRTKMTAAEKSQKGKCKCKRASCQTSIIEQDFYQENEEFKHEKLPTDGFYFVNPCIFIFDAEEKNTSQSS